jgi:GTPase SAR1 family protein
MTGRQDIFGALIENAVAVGERNWNRSKIMLVGEGRAGKTALARALLGKPFECDSVSTCGIDQFTVNCSVLQSQSQKWVECGEQESALDAALASIVDDNAVLRTSIASVPASDASHPVERPVFPRFHEFTRNIFGLISAGQKPSKDREPDASSEHITSSLVHEHSESVFRTLCSGTLMRSGIEISLYDFGGQSVFHSIHPFFLTRLGAYLVVFDMNWFYNNPDGSFNPSQALLQLSFWINSVVMSTRLDGKVSPLFLVGTHKDQVPSATAHAEISQAITASFGSSMAWSAIIENSAEQLVFFPVDSVRGFSDRSVMHLTHKVESSLVESEHFKQKRPLSWFQGLDNLKSLGKSTVPYVEARRILSAGGITDGDIDIALEFYRDMGMLMWYADDDLRAVVILDAVKFFVQPATRIICSPDLHSFDAHQYCKKLHFKDYQRMVEKGIISDRLLMEFLSFGDDREHAFLVRALMLRYGLLVRWRQEAANSEEQEAVTTLMREDTTNYFVPALFQPQNGSINSLPSGSKFTTVFLVCSLSERVCRSTIQFNRLQDCCFFPGGLFSQLLCAVLDWSQLTLGVDAAKFTLFSDMAYVSFANTEFRMLWKVTENVIQIDVAGGTPMTVFSRVAKLLRKLIDESIQSLYFAGHVLHQPTSSSEAYLTPLVGTVSSMLAAVGAVNDITVDRANVIEQHPWLCDTKRLHDGYDVFLSYRWGRDNEFVVALRDRLLDYAVEHRGLAIFIDKTEITVGQRFDMKFCRSLLHSEVLVPVISPTALERMMNPSTAETDNVLVEWLTAVVVLKFRAQISGCRLEKVVPLVICDRDGNEYFKMRDGLSTQRPLATQKAVLELFTQLSLHLSVEAIQFINTVTVKEIVDGIMKWQAVQVSWVTHGLPEIVSICTADITKAFFAGRAV